MYTFLSFRACIAWLCCASIMAVLAFKKPYLYKGGNFLSVASYGSLLAAFTQALVKKLEYDSYKGYVVTPVLTQILFLTWLLPYVVGFAALVSAPHFLMRAATYYCARCARCRKSEWERGSTTNVMKNRPSKVKVAFSAEHKKGLFLLSTFQSLLPTVKQVLMTAKRNAHRVSTYHGILVVSVVTVITAAMLYQ